MATDPKSDLARRHCEACTGATPALTEAEISAARQDLHSDWAVNDRHLTREFRFSTFARAFAKATAIALLAEREGHHPDLEVGWGRLVVNLTSHAISALSWNDFILAAQIDRLD